MAWDDVLPSVLRTLLQDTAATPAYSDDTLAQMILVGAIGLQAQVSFAVYYAADIVNQTLTPDPTAATPPDYSFINLACLDSAVKMVTAEIRGLTQQGIEIQDGRSRIRLQRDPRALQAMLDAYKQQYETALYAYKTGGNDGLGEAIVGPYSYLPDFPIGVSSQFEGYPTGRSWYRGGW